MVPRSIRKLESKIEEASAEIIVKEYQEVAAASVPPDHAPDGERLAAVAAYETDAKNNDRGRSPE